MIHHVEHDTNLSEILIILHTNAYLTKRSSQPGIFSLFIGCASQYHIHKQTFWKYTQEKVTASKLY